MSFLCGHEGRTQALQEVLRVEVETGVHVGKAVEGRGEGVGGGLDGPDEVRKSRPAIAVLELRVGDYGGFALAKDIHALPSMGNLPLVMLCDRPHDRWLCHQAGAQQVIVKPLPDPLALLLALDAVLAPAL